MALNSTVSRSQLVAHGIAGHRTENLKTRRTAGAARIRAQELPAFSRALATMLSGGLPVLAALKVLESQSHAPSFRAVVRGVRARVEAGHRLAAAMGQYPAVFDRMYIGMLRGGEFSGKLAEGLEGIAEHLESRLALRRSIQAAVVYPTIVAGIAALLGTGIIVFLVPAFEKIYDDLGGTLPRATQFLLWLSHAVRQSGLSILGVAAVLGFSARRFGKTERGAYIWGRIKLSLPVFGDLSLKVALYQFAESLSLMLRSGVPILQAMHLAADTTSSPVLRNIVLESRAMVRDGEPMSAALRKSRLIPPLMLEMLSAGEKTGKVDDMLNTLADYYRNEVAVVLKGLTAAIEPLLITLLGIVIGGMVVSVFLPIFSMHEIVGF